MGRAKKVFLFLWRLILAIVLLAATAPIAPAANDIHISGAAYYVTLANQVPWNQLSANYIFTPQSPNVGLCMFVENSNTTFTHSLTITAFQTGNPSLTSYSANPNLWAASQIVNNFSSVSPAAVQSVFINATGAANVAVVISGTTAGSGSPDVANVFVVQSTVQQCGSANAAETVMGVQPNLAITSKVNPVLMAGYDYAGTSIQAPAMNNDGVGNDAFELANGLTIADDTVSSQGSLANKSNGGPLPMVVPQLKGQDGRFQQTKNIDVFQAASASAAGNTAVWAPGAGIKFHLECISVEITGDATLAVAGEETITLQDATTPISGFLFISFVPATALDTRGALYQSGPICVNNGFLSSTANNTLNVNLGTALTAGKVVVRAWGTLN